MKIFTETKRLILREIVPSDVARMYQLDSNTEVHKYLGNNPVKSIDESIAAIKFVRQQYVDNGIGRWAVVEKASGNFIGWSGLKYVTEPIAGYVDYYDLGYRFIQEYWGKGYATESAIASLAYGFEVLQLTEIKAMADIENGASNHVLKKVGLQFVETVVAWDQPHHTYTITQEEWKKRMNKNVK